MTEYTRQVAEFVVGAAYDRIPPLAIEKAKDAILDAVGVALAGSQDPAGRIAAEFAREEHPGDDAALFGHGQRASATGAAFANGVATHAMDFDASFTMMGQPTAGLMATVFAAAEPLGASGRQLLEAYVAGFEVIAKLAWSMPKGWGEGGWHATATLGSLGCTAAAARLLGLDVEQTRMALGIVSSMAGGVVGNFGTMSKPLHAGQAARNGVVAAKLAQKGYSGNASTLEAPVGFMETFGAGAPFDLSPLDQLGTVYDMEQGLRYKAYPCGGLAHTAIDAALALRQEHEIAPDAVEHVDAQVTSYTARRIIYGIPETELQAKFSIPYLLARSIYDGPPTIDAFTDEAIAEPAVLALAGRISMEVDPSFDNASGGRPARVTVRLKDGRSLARQVDFPKGNPESPFSPDELRAKFRSCARHALNDKTAAEALDQLDKLESLDNVSSLSRLLMA
jgi:2-methylcitrate dehydratase PrpD